MSVYLILDLTIHDAEGYAEYVEQVRPVVEAHGGRYLTRGGEVTTLSGDWKPERLVLVAFPSEEDLRGWLASDAYAALAQLRKGTTTARAIFIEGEDAASP